MFFSRNRANSATRHPEDAEWLLRDTTHLVASLSRSGLKALVRQQRPVARVTSFSDNLQDLCSYTTDPASPSTIFVPGAPRKYQLPALPTAFGQQPITALPLWGSNDESTASAPTSFASFNPLLRALRLTNPTHSLRNTHIVTDRVTLHQLLTFTTRTGPSRPFRLHLLRVHDTLFLVRSARDAAMLLSDEAGRADANSGDDRADRAGNDDDDDEARAYRRGFRARFTVPLVSDEGDAAAVAAGAGAANAHHYRVVSYDFGSLKLVVRVDVDAVLRDDPTTQQQQQQQQQTEAPSIVDTIAANLAFEEAAAPAAAAAVAASNSSSSSSSTDPSTEPQITAFAQGPAAAVQREEVTDFWLRKHKRRFLERLRSSSGSGSRDVLLRAWFGRTAFVVQGMHLAGTVSKEPVWERPSARWAGWEDGRQEELKRTHKLLEWLRAMVGKGDGEGAVVQRAVLVCEVVNGQGAVRMYGVREGAVIETLDERDVAGLWAAEG